MTPDSIREICRRQMVREGPLLPILHEIQATCGGIDAKAEGIIAEELNLSRAEVHGVVSFYHDFRTTPDARPEVQICRAEACQARGIETLMEGATVAAGERVRLSTVYCLGLCSAGPAARVGDDLHARLDGPALEKLIGAAQ
jgi:formate dehydrogenase subunit gamma